MKRLAEVAKRDGEDLIVTEGGRHTKVQIGDRFDVVPRHTEINEKTARGIIRKMEGRP